MRSVLAVQLLWTAVMFPPVQVTDALQGEADDQVREDLQRVPDEDCAERIPLPL